MGEVVGSIAGSLIAARGAKKAAQSQAAAAERNAQLAYEQSKPRDVSGLFGTATFDPETQAASLALSPELQEIYKQRLARAGGYTQAISAYDPSRYQEQFYEEEKALAAPAEERERLALEERLLAQGMLGSTGGALRQQSLLEAQSTKDLARRAEARSAAQQELTFLRGLESGDVGTATQLGALPMDYASLGRGIGTGMSSAAMTGASMRNVAAQNVADTQAAFWSKLGGQVGQYGGTLFGTSTPTGTTAMGNQYFASPAATTASPASAAINSYLYGGRQSGF